MEVSYHRMLSNVPSVELEMLYFQKELVTISSSRRHHTFKTQEDSVANEGALTFPARVKLFSSCTILVIHLSRSRPLNGLFRQQLTPCSCKMLVNLPSNAEIVFVLVCRSAHFTRSTMWVPNRSQMMACQTRQESLPYCQCSQVLCCLSACC